MKKKSLKTLIIILSVSVVLFIIYNYFIKGDGEKDFSSLSSESGIRTTDNIEQDNIDNEIITILNEVNNIRINDEILYHPAFDTLQDFTLNIQIPKIIGRENPFLPIGFDLLVEESEILEDEISLDGNEKEIHMEDVEL